MGPDEKERILQDARVHLNFICGLCQQQAAEGRYFIHEHPQSASSSDLEEIRRLDYKIGLEYKKLELNNS